MLEGFCCTLLPSGPPDLGRFFFDGVALHCRQPPTNLLCKLVQRLDPLGQVAGNSGLGGNLLS